MILLTGGLGFLGCNLAYYLAKAGGDVLLTEHRTSRVPSFLEPFMNRRIWTTSCDILDFSDLWYVLDNHPVESIIHAAGTPGRKGYLYRSMNINIMGTMNVLEASRIKKIGRLTYISSHSVYARGERFHKEDEDLPLASSTVISMTKKAGDMMCDHYAREYGMALTIARVSQVYGPLYKSGRNPLQKMVEDGIAGRKTELTGVAPNEGNNLIYVKDCCRVLASIHMKEKPAFRVYNVGGRYLSHEEMAETVRKVLPGAKIRLGPQRAEGQGRMFVDLERIEGEFGFKPVYDLEGGLKDWIRWLEHGEYSDTESPQAQGG